MQRDVKVGLVLGVLLVAVVAVVFFRRDDEERDKFAQLLPAPDAVADRARDLLGHAPNDPYPVAPEYLADAWRSPKPPRSVRTPTPAREKNADLAPEGEPIDRGRDPSRTSAFLLPPETSPLRPPVRSKPESAVAPPKPFGTDVHIRGGQVTEYTIQDGDRLSDIAHQFLGSPSAWTRIYEANRDVLWDPNQIPVGQTIRIPAPANDLAYRTETPATPVSHSPRAPARDGAYDLYTVRDGDTLMNIAKRHYGSRSKYFDILQANQDQLSDPLELKSGMVLRLPRESSAW